MDMIRRMTDFTNIFEKHLDNMNEYYKKNLYFKFQGKTINLGYLCYCSTSKGMSRGYLTHYDLIENEEEFILRKVGRFNYLVFDEGVYKKCKTKIPDELGVYICNYSQHKSLNGQTLRIGSLEKVRSAMKVEGQLCGLKNIDLYNVNKIFENFNIFNEKDALDLLKNECVDNKRIKELDLEKDFDGFIEILNTIFSTSRTAMNILINLYEEYDEKGMFSDLTLFNDLKTIITTNKEFKVLETDKSEQTSLQLSKLLIDDYENSYKVFDYFNLFKVYQKKLVKKTNSHKFNALKKISAYEEAKKVITSSKDALPTDELMLIDPDIAFEIIKYKSNKLEKEYREEKELYEINNNEITPLNEALYKYGIHFFTYEEKKKILDNISLNDINLLLSILNSSKMKFLLSDKNTLLEIMYSSNLSIISNINDLINNKIINESFIEKNIGILFNKECSVLKNIIPKNMDFSKNLQALNNAGIQINNVKKHNINILLQDEEKLTSKIELAKIYGFDLKNDDLLNFSILEDSNIFNIVDQLLEQGINVTTEILSDIKKKDPNFAKRTKLAIEIGLNDLIIDNKINPIVANKNSFYIKNEAIDEYLENNINTLLEQKYIECLENDERLKIDPTLLMFKEIKMIEESFKVSDTLYNINGISISRIKFLRNMTSLVKNFDIHEDTSVKITNALLYNSILTNNQIKQLSSFEDTKLKIKK